MPIIRVYLDTSVLSALYDERTPERLELTKTAWENLKDYDVYVSDLVVEELNATHRLLREMFCNHLSFKVIDRVQGTAFKLSFNYSLPLWLAVLRPGCCRELRLRF